MGRWLIPFVALPLLACEAGTSPSPTMQPKAQPLARENLPPAGERAQGAGRGKEHPGCGCESEPVRDHRIEHRADPTSGSPLEVVGGSLAGASRLSVTEINAAAASHVGQVVRVEGDVTAMCHHKRGWFALQDPGDRSGQQLQVLAAPAFLVPAGSIGKKARAEGRLEWRQISVETAQHYARNHDLGTETGTVQRRLVLRATGAEFY